MTRGALLLVLVSSVKVCCGRWLAMEAVNFSMNRTIVLNKYFYFRGTWQMVLIIREFCFKFIFNSLSFAEIFAITTFTEILAMTTFTEIFAMKTFTEILVMTTFTEIIYMTTFTEIISMTTFR